ncbi:MAG: hypothetical protein K8I00_11430, partial [Candidatus Omnitrophica bacterium]|nr:hypothetical protein [Candidatus Omnitrophota bacterium]
YGAHGDNTQIVIGVGNISDCFYAAQMARYFAEKLRLPVFIMSDFQMANSYKVVPKPKAYALGDDVNDISDEILDHFGMTRLPDDIEMVRKDQSNPGVPGHMRRVTGLNTDDQGKVNYFAKSNQRSHAVRNEKIHHVQRSLKEPTLIGERDGGDILIVGWGSTYGAIREAVESCQGQGLKVGGICFKVIYPLPLMLADVFKKFKRVVTVEGAFGDYLKRTPLAMFLRSKTLVDVKPMICRATGRPITPLTIENAIKEILNKE